MCKHNWQPILPTNDAVSEPQRISFAVDKMLSRLGDVVYCENCNHTGHYIKSYRGGIRRHFEGSHNIERANKIREKYGLQLLNNEPSINK